MKLPTMEYFQGFIQPPNNELPVCSQICQEDISNSRSNTIFKFSPLFFSTEHNTLQVKGLHNQKIDKKVSHLIIIFISKY